jgi:hypothetical protein
MFFRATLFSALGASKRFLATQTDGGRRTLTVADYYLAGAMAGGAAALFEGPIDFYKSQVCPVSLLAVFARTQVSSLGAGMAMLCAPRDLQHANNSFHFGDV